MSDDDWEAAADDEPEFKPKVTPAKKSEWSDEEEEEEEDSLDVEKLKQEKEALLKRLEEINAKLPVEGPKESSKKGKQQKKLLKEKEDAEKAAQAEKLKADSQMSTQRKIEESDFENVQDLMGSGAAKQGEASGSGKFEAWELNSTTKLQEIEAFAKYTSQKIVTFEKEFLYVSLLRILLQETTKSIDVSQSKELLLVLTKGKEDFNVVDLLRSLLRDADKDLSPEDVVKELGKEAEKPKAGKGKEPAKPMTARQELLKLLLHDLVRDNSAEIIARIVSEGCGMTLTKDQEKQVSKKRMELIGDPSVRKAEAKAVRPSDHKSMEMYDAFGKGGGEEWGGGGGTRGDDYDFM